jgi:hypothetical protein
VRFQNLRLYFPLVVFVCVLSAASALCQTGDKLSAREIFYSRPTDSVPAKKKVPKQAPKTLAQNPTGTEKSPLPAQKPADAVSRNSSTETIVPVSSVSEEAAPLGLRYSILKRTGPGDVEVDPDTNFRSGDRIRLRIAVNTDGYLYIVNRGTSGNWKLLFPSTQIADGGNHVQPNRQYEIPPGSVFTFDEQAGEEKLFLVFAHKPVSDLEDLIYSLSGGRKIRDSFRPLVAQANIEDKLISQLRTLYSRDLIIEKVDDKATAPPSAPEKEKAVYVANPSRDADARLVADITLLHK